MNIKEYILNEIEVLTLNSSVKRVQKICKRLPITHVPIVENQKLIACISESDFQTIEDNKSSVSKYSYLFSNFFAYENATILEVMKLFANNQSNIMPVLNKEKNYIGYYELNDILDLFCSSPFMYNDGVVMIIEKAKKDFSMSEICQIVEHNQSKMLGLYNSSEISNTIQATIKISSEDINEVIQTLRSYKYTIVSEHKDDIYLQDLRERSEYLQKYLNM